MCGIAGLFTYNPLKINKKLAIHQMTNALAHRGPDAEGFFIEENIALGHRRLSIIDTSMAANQPMVDTTERYVLVFNGEIYNYREIKSKLSNFSFSTQSDSEVILAAYIQWKEKCVDEMNGIFAFAIWDKQDKTLFIARDRLGVKPLYYYQDENVFIFASELRAILKSGLVKNKYLSLTGLADYLLYQSVHAPNTLVENIFQLQPAEYAFIDTKGIVIKSYWDLVQPHEIETDDYSVIKKKVYQHLSKAVELQMVSDVPIGAFLSGGIDSSAIVALMAQCSTQSINTFTVSFEESRWDESEYAAIVAKKFNTKHEKIVLKPTVFLEELPQILDSMDSPSSDGPNTYIVSKVTKQAGITVALSGLGGDELFAGYGTFLQFYKLYHNNLFWVTPVAIRNLLKSSLRSLLKGRTEKINAILLSKFRTMESIYPPFRQLYSNKAVENLINNYGGTNFATSRLREIQPKLTKMPLLSQFSIAEIMTYTQSVLLKDSDQMSMASALELRVPFFDHNLVEYVLSVPDKYKYPHTPKKLMTDALGELLPREIVNRTKMGFELPWENWLKNELRTYCQRYLEELKNYKVFNHIYIENIWSKFLKGDKQIIWSEIWALVVLSQWLKDNEIEEG